jgi:hypothetical protein
LDLKTQVAGAGMFLLGLWALCKGILRWADVFGCFSHGVQWRGRFVRYDDIAGMQVGITTFAVYGSEGRTYKFVLQGSDSAGPFTFRPCFSRGKPFWRRRKSNSSDVDYLIRAAARPIVCRMKEDIQRQGATRWIGNAMLTGASLVLSDIGREIPYVEIRQMRLSQGFLNGNLQLACRDGFRTTIMAGKENFYPGYYFLLEKVPPESTPGDTSADAFAKPVRRIYLIRAIGFFLVAGAIMTLLLLVKVDELGWTLGSITAGLFGLMGLVMLWCRLPCELVSRFCGYDVRRKRGCAQLSQPRSWTHPL